MKAAVFAGTLAIAASVVSANPAPAKVEARATSSAASSSLPTVTPSGNAFYAGSNRFYIRGVDYQPGGSSDAADPLANQAGCDRDIPQFQQLGLNTIRVYTVDNTANHDYCMNKLAAAGIYVALDVNTPKYSINRGNPATSYNSVYLQSIFATMDAFAGYSNTLLFFSGNEVINDDTNTNCAPYVKAVTRDMKQYRASRGMREIPIGYSAADIADTREQLAAYLNCGTDDQRSDFFAFNDYSWCDPSSFTTSGWSTNVQTFSNYSIPLFLSEYGCITNDRTFQEVAALYNTEMTSVYSGGLVYEYSQEGNGYGLVEINGDSTSQVGSQFSDLMNQFKQNPAPTGNGGAKTGGTASTCPAGDDKWDITPFSGENLPATPSGAATLFEKGAGTGPGLAGDGSQDASGGSSATASPGSGSATVYTTQAGSTGSSSSTASKGAAASVMAPPFEFGGLATIAIAVFSTFAGAALL